MAKAKKTPLLIIGAGITGLSVANELSGRYAVTILEAQPRTGGRITTIGDHMEAGPEFIHGNLPFTFELVKKAGTTLEKVTGRWYHVSNGTWKENTGMVEGWDTVLKKIDALQNDMTLDAFLETHFSGEDNEDLRREARAFATGFDLADPVKASVKSLGKEWSEQTEEMYRVKEGYISLISYLQEKCIEKGCRILTNKKVRQIDWQNNAVTAYTDEGEQFTADKIIITLPAGVLQKKIGSCSINFTPPVDEYENAWQKIGFGSVLKLLLRFKTAFWENQKKEIGFILSDKTIPTWWTQLPCQQPILTGWLGEPSAVIWDGMDDATVIKHAIGTLSEIFSLPTEEISDQLEEHHIFRWHTVETASGGYSYNTPLSAEAIKLLTTPIEDTVYFAGEALYSGDYPGTVEAALNSAADTVKKIATDFTD